MLVCLGDQHQGGHRQGCKTVGLDLQVFYTFCIFMRIVQLSPSYLQIVKLLLNRVPLPFHHFDRESLMHQPKEGKKWMSELSPNLSPPSISGFTGSGPNVGT